MMRVAEVRAALKFRLEMGSFVTDKTGVKTVELVGASFIADEESIFGEVNRGYVDREIEWYESKSRSVYDIPPPVPEIWKQVASKDGLINSNYGWCIYSEENGNQYERVRELLSNDPDTRRALMIYTRPSMWSDYNRDGMSDFMCTNAVQYLVRGGALHAVVQMRSNDAVFGYKNDRAWQQHVLEKLARDIGTDVGNIYWNAGSLHVYERHFNLISSYNSMVD